MWPLNSSSAPEYAVGVKVSRLLTGEAKGYFFLNSGWRRSRGIFSHAGALWSSKGWRVQVWFLGGPRRRRHGWTRRRGGLRRTRQRHRPTRARPAGYPGKWSRCLSLRKWRSRGLTTGASTWGAPRGATWGWVRLPRGRTYTPPAGLLARIRYRLGSGRIEVRSRRVGLPLLRAALRLGGVVGAEVRCAGRFSRRQRATQETFRAGYLGRTNAGVTRVVQFTTLALRFGAVGVTLIVSFA